MVKSETKAFVGMKIAKGGGKADFDRWRGGLDVDELPDSNPVKHMLTAHMREIAPHIEADIDRTLTETQRCVICNESSNDAAIIVAGEAATRSYLPFCHHCAYSLAEVLICSLPESPRHQIANDIYDKFGRQIPTEAWRGLLSKMSSGDKPQA